MQALNKHVFDISVKSTSLQVACDGEDFSQIPTFILDRTHTTRVHPSLFPLTCIMGPFSARTDAIVDCVIDALHDPLRPKYCARFYVDAIVSIENTDDDYADKEERKGHLISSSLHRRVRRHRHDLLDAL